MHAVIVWWDLSESAQTIESLRTYLLDESVATFAEVRGLRLKIWIADPQTNRWGASCCGNPLRQPRSRCPAARRHHGTGTLVRPGRRPAGLPSASPAPAAAAPAP